MKNLNICLVIVFSYLSLWNGTVSASPHPKDNGDSTVVNSLNEVVVSTSNTVQKGNQTTVYINKELRHGARNTGQLLGNLQGFNWSYSKNDLSYHGSSNIMILEDGLEKPASYIKELYHLRFYKIDITDHPQGKYAGYDVLINLYTKADYEGYEGSLAVYNVNYLGGDNGKGKTVGMNDEQASFTYTKNKWNIVARYRFTFSQYSYNSWYSKYYYLNNLKEQNIPNAGKAFNSTGLGRTHDAYLALDHQFGKNNSLSLTYSYNTDNSHASDQKTLARSDLASLQLDTLFLSVNKTEQTKSHNLALFYRGHSDLWQYTSDFNYVNRASKPYSNRTESSGYTLINEVTTYDNTLKSKPCLFL